jgi:hypothetical protein
MDTVVETNGLAMVLSVSPLASRCIAISRTRRVPVASSDGALYVTTSGLVDRSP